jgi:hypothetical protein
MTGHSRILRVAVHRVCMQYCVDVVSRTMIAVDLSGFLEECWCR